MTALTDGVRRREFGVRRHQPVLRHDDGHPAVSTDNRAAHDYLPSPAPALSTVSYPGIADVQASSSGADATAVVNISPANGPWSAVDGNPFTAWRIGAFNGAVGQWLQVDLAAPVDAVAQPR